MYSQNIWQISVNERIYDASFEEVVEWIKEGSILPEDKIRRGNLRWIRADKVPELYEHFHANSLGADLSNSVFIANAEAAEVYTNFQVENFHESTAPNNKSVNVSINNFENSNRSSISFVETGDIEKSPFENIACAVHPELDPFYICEICDVLYCKTCPHSFGSSVKLCLDCGGLCVPYSGQRKNAEKIHGSVNKPYRRTEKAENQIIVQNRAQLKKEDLFNALKYPFSFPASFLIGSSLLLLLMFGVGLAVLGGKMFSSAAIVFGVAAAMLTFCVLAKIVENFSQKKFTQNFLPKLNKYNIWEDIVHPGFLSLAVYLISFGMFFAITAGAGFYTWHQVSNELENVEARMRETDNQFNVVIKNAQSSSNDGSETQKTSQMPLGENSAQSNSSDLEKMIETSRENNYQAIFGVNYLGDNSEILKLAKSFIRIAVPFHLPMLFAFIFGLFYFPALSSIAGSERSLQKIFSPRFALKKIRSFGLDYFKILVMSALFTVVFLVVTVGCYLLLLNYDLKLAGFLSSTFLGSILLFYFWIVFSYFLGMTAFNESRNAVSDSFPV